MPADSSSLPPLIRNLLRPDCYPHPVDRIRIEETHISWVLLTGRFAYKVKKPVNFGFLDFSTLEKRRRYCVDEVRLNQRLAASLYFDVVPICGGPECPYVGGAGPVLEFAVRMREFAATSLASIAATHGGLSRSQFYDLAMRMARFHDSLTGCMATNVHQGSDSAKQAVDENFRVLKERCYQPDTLTRLSQIENWMTNGFREFRPLLDQRCLDGYVRECHGDLHLGNLVILDGALIPFDCIEFSEQLRRIDVMSEVAFLVMDLEIHELRHFGWHFLNTYLSATGDYRGLPLLRYFLVYRAMVRAKIALLSAGNTGAESGGRFRKYLDYGLAMIRGSEIALMIMHGFSGAGKSRLAGLICDELPAVWLRSDVERKRLGPGKDLTELYDRKHTELTYENLRQLAEISLVAGYSVVVDATFLLGEFRRQFKGLADALAVPFVIVDVNASVDILRRRIEDRQQAGTDPSDANQQTLDLQIRIAQPLTSEEIHCVYAVPGDQPFDAAALIGQLRIHLFRPALISGD